MSGSRKCRFPASRIPHPASRLLHPSPPDESKKVASASELLAHFLSEFIHFLLSIIQPICLRIQSGLKVAISRPLKRLRYAELLNTSKQRVLNTPKRTSPSILA